MLVMFKAHYDADTYRAIVGRADLSGRIKTRLAKWTFALVGAALHALKS